jgi:hypothetical protein
MANGGAIHDALGEIDPTTGTSPKDPSETHVINVAKNVSAGRMTVAESLEVRLATIMS